MLENFTLIFICIKVSCNLRHIDITTEYMRLYVDMLYMQIDLEGHLS